MKHLFPFVLCTLLAAVVPATADVVDSAPDGFTIKIAVDVASPQADVYRALVERVGTWWSADHTWSGDNANLSIDARPGGCWCEKLANGGGVQHMTVAYVDPGKILRFRGALGPLQTMAVDGSMTWELTTAGDKTHLQFTYTVGGYRASGLGATMARPVNDVLTLQVQRLKKLVETGQP
jgi:uncharacterized protein YndB with AHSA1/START domain